MKLTLSINIPGLRHANDIDTCKHGWGISKYILSGWFLYSTCKRLCSTLHSALIALSIPFSSVGKGSEVSACKASYIQLYCYIVVYPVIYIVICIVISTATYSLLVISGYIWLHPVTYSYTYSYRVIYSYIRWYWLALPPWWVLRLPDTLRFSHKQLWFQLWLTYYTLHQVWFVIFDTRTFSPINLGKVIILSNGLGPLSIIRSCD